MTRKQGKVVSKIEYNKNGHRVVVDLRLIERGGVFTYIVDHNDPEIKDRDNDPNALRDRVLSRLDVVLSIEWADKICIKVVGQIIDSEPRGGAIAHDTELKVCVEVWQVGTTTTGKLVHRQKPWLSRGEMWPCRIEAGLPYIVSERHHCNIASSSMIDDTPDNRAKVRVVQKAFEQLSTNLRALLGQDSIQATLANVRLLGLPAPGPDVPELVDDSCEVEDEDEDD